ncbi:hypothetical protein V6N13_143134 [Hibiscus sabdariffa]
MLSDTFDVQFKVIYPKSNMADDRMTKLDGSLQSYTVPPPELSNVLNRDILGNANANEKHLYSRMIGRSSRGVE